MRAEGLIALHGQTGKRIKVIKADDKGIDKAHDGWIFSLDFSRDSRVLASGSSDASTKLWSMSNWQQIFIGCGGIARCVRFSSHNTYYQASLAVATDHNIQIYQNYGSALNLSYYVRDDYKYEYGHNYAPFPT
jgi:WD40 repeat protein